MSPAAPPTIDPEDPAALRERVDALEARVTELEIQASYDRRNHDLLDEVVREFAARVEALERRLTELGEAVATAGDP
ncbi:hypothetical protein G6O69_19430 [Pseudenhygromyxa sp. WMMC2535]|uniref:hypothetical protein n=1 Tax=Pseudenhygromyxa sp. WMMC2535 TaxID=2712867 RepID=UPI00155431A1|nr:hypothetical protein [Pseudenhygromyxa sp. WMMC2535]NVB40026.1 hypothetical protein [Pseudenhygromyxa sp. WMMC2535]